MAEVDPKALREKIRSDYKLHGADDMTDRELLEAAITVSLARIDGKKTTESLMKDYSNITNIFSSSPKNLMKTDGLNENAAVYLSLVHPIKSRIQADQNKKIKNFSDHKNIEIFSNNLLFYQLRESVILATLDSKKRLIKADFISQGSANFANITPADVSRRIVEEKPTYVFVAHNHLTDSFLPSFSDINFTVNLSNWLGQFGIKLIDHVIVCKNGTLSMACDEDYAFIFD